MITGKSIRRAVASTVTGVLFATGLVLGIAAPAQAANAAAFDPGYIISDARFFDSGAMTEGQIQAFLNAQVPTCVAGNGIPCLKNYTAATFSRASVAPGHCYAYQSEGVESAAHIILKVAKACNINPQVLLATLQKEQGLITATSPTERQYRVAMGYGCPDTAPCDAQYYGFYNQVYKAAWQFRQYTYSPKTWRYKIGQVAVQYHPNAACGAPTVNIRNQATANLYNYTPYQPNRASLANLGGVGDSCSSYGNRNFWRYFTDWFGTTTGQISPIGSLDVAVAVPGGIRVGGWALDPDMTGSAVSTFPITVAVHYAGVKRASIVAKGNRPDVGALYNRGNLHGFDTFIPITGAVTGPLCVYATNIGPGANVQIGCVNVTTRSGAPIGSFDTSTGGVGTVSVGGWALDPDTTAATRIDLYVGKTLGYSFPANTARSDVAALYPGYGAAHGFATTVKAPAGTHNVCAYAINVGAGSNKLLGCKTTTVRAAVADGGRVPVGSLDIVKGQANGIQVGGWTLDPDTSAPIQVHFYIDKVGSSINADQQRSDIAALYPANGGAHGFSATLPASKGTHNICAYGINTGTGGHLTLGCRTVTVGATVTPSPTPIADKGRVPFGNVDVIKRTTGGYQVAGWAIDPDTTSPIAVHVYVDSVGTAIPAQTDRPDVGKAYPTYGSPHGFSATIPASAGTHKVCVYAINQGAGGHTLLYCRTA
ncbi:hypothetical protein HD599_002546 [Conyzicola lurida]|uniref:Hemagglutinin n=1 Tax=Conyzicola lurida TaxID=1172621 RepID=A0A841ARM0_9MICO|nr:hypothetical protein [Conyzicola lurida]MBB5844223.1 hypothetical protein [Conyzicola lurida]